MACPPTKKLYGNVSCLFGHITDLSFIRIFGQLILRKIIEPVATRCHILRPECTKFDFVWGGEPQAPLGSLQRSPRLLSWI